MDQSTQQFDSDGSAARFVLVTCARCGCRLREDEAATPSGHWYHFAPIGGRDARGCRIDCADAAHDALGAPIAVFA